MSYLATSRARNGRVIVMGRSLGSGPAIELAANGEGVAGLIIESGYADPYRIAWRRGFDRERVSADDLAFFSNSDKMKRVSVPVLVMHGREDELILPDEAEMNPRRCRLRVEAARHFRRARP